MYALALKSILAKKLRTFSTALAVVLGIAFLSGTLVFTDTIRRSFDDLFADVFDTTDVYVRSSTEVDLGFGQTQRGRMPADVADAVREVEGVADIQPVVQGYAQLVGEDGEVVGDPGRGAPTFAMTYVSGPLSPWRLTDGSRAPSGSEVVVDQGTADAGGVEIGDDVTVLTQTGPHRLTLVGTAMFGSIASPGGASIMLVDLPTSQQLLLDGADEIDALMIDAVQGIDQPTLTERVAAVLPDGTEALTGTEIIEETQNTIGEGLAFFDTFLLVFAAIGLVVGCFTIYNTFQIVVSQRAREMALLRAVGATQRQVIASQLVEAVVVGVVASVVGLIAGLGVAGLLSEMLAAFGIDVPGGGTVLATRTVVVSLVVGTIVTVVAATLPAVRAGRIPPLAVIRSMAVGDTQHSRSRLVSGGIVTLFGGLVYGVGLARSELAWVGVGALVTFVGIFVLGPLLARPAARVLGAPVAATMGVAGELAQQNAIRNPKRTARTGGALMVGVALVAAITMIAASTRDWSRDVFGEQFTGDFVVSTSMFNVGGLSPELQLEIAGLPEVAAATGVRVGAAHDDELDRDLQYVAVDPATVTELFDIGMPSDDLAQLSSDGVLLHDGEAADRGVDVGDQLTWTFLDGRTRTLTVEGIYTKDDLAGRVVISHALHERSGVDQFDFSIYIESVAAVDDAEVTRALETVVDAYPNAKVESKTAYIDSQAAQIDPILNLMYGLLALAVLIALVNIANSLTLSIHERKHELGLLRAVGMTGGQTRHCVELEAMLVAVIGTLTGLVVGTFFGWSISIVGRGTTWDAFVLPVQPLVVIALLAIAGALLSALRPAWHASKLDVLRAIATE
jgi:putative ABC transport system permease protein